MPRRASSYAFAGRGCLIVAFCAHAYCLTRLHLLLPRCHAFNPAPALCSTEHGTCRRTGWWRTRPRPLRTTSSCPRQKLVAAAAAPPSNDDKAEAATTTTKKAITDMPFFAVSATEPLVTDAAATAGAAAGPSTMAITTRLPLGTLFDSREYIFSTQTNVRGYEWSTKEVDELFDDLADASIRGDYDYELSQIVLVPMEWDRDTYGLGARYDVYDGQQRLVTLCLLLAALRESFRAEDGMEETVEEVSAMLNPPKVRKEGVLRIELRRRDNDVLRQILTPGLVPTDGDGEGSVRVDLPTSRAERSSLSLTNRRVLENYERLLARVSDGEDFTARERVDLLDYLVEHVYLLVCVPETGRIARNIVMAQGKGMDNEPIDDFKGLVCFRYTLDEDDMYQTFDEWDQLADTPDVERGSVGRETISSASALRATATLRTKIRKNDLVYALEQWLRQDLVEHGGEGKDFFARNVKPASLALQWFREGKLDLVGFTDARRAASVRGTVGTTIVSRLRFLRLLTSTVSSAREVEMVVLELLLRAREGGGGGDDAAGGTGGSRRKAFTMQRFDEYLHAVELAALIMVITRPSPLQRHRRCFDMLDAIASDDLDGMLEAAASGAEKSDLLVRLVSFEFGSSPANKKIALAVLERINAHLLIKEGDADVLPVTQLQVEHVLPATPTAAYWDEYWLNQEDREKWTHLLGNLVLLSRRATAREGNRSFPEKKRRYEKEAWPLTKRLSEIEFWDKDVLMEQHSKNVGLIGKIWGL